jgi:hypothetical protein
MLQQHLIMAALGNASGAAALGTYVHEVGLDAPVHWWRLNETSGTSAADSGSSVSNGTYTGTFTLNQAAFVNGGKSVSFPGGSNYVDTNTATNFTAACTLEAWINAAASGSGTLAHIVGKNKYFAALAADFPIKITWNKATNKVGFELSKGDDFSADASLLSGVLSTGTDYHVVARYTANGAVDLWINKVQVASTTVAFTINTNALNWRIAAATDHGGGIGNGDGDNGFSGRVAEVAIYNSFLSSTRIAAHYDSRAN